jgi:hypothetical protein
MNSQFLFPHKFKKVGWILLVLGIVSGLIMQIFEIDSDYFGRSKMLTIYNDGIFVKDSGFLKIISNGLLDELVSVFIIAGGILVGFCQTKK